MNKLYKGILIGLILVTPFWLGVYYAFSASYYVCSDGNGAGATDGSDWANCMDGFDDIGTPSGDDILYLRDDDGDYRETLTIPSSGTSGHPITYTADTGESPVISGADVVLGSWSGYSGEWIEIWDAETQTGDSTWTDVNDNPDRNQRYLIDGSNISTTATTIRLKLRAHSSLQTDIQDCAIGPKKSASDVYDFDSAPTNVQQGSTDTFSIAAGSEEYTDSLSFTLTVGTDYLVSFYCVNGSDTSKLEPVSNMMWYKDDIVADESETIDITGYSEINQLRLISAIEGYYAATNTYQMALATEPNMVLMDDTVLTNGSDQNSLNDHEWYWVSNVLYIRDDSGNPDITGVVIEASQRDYCIVVSDKDYLDFDSLEITMANGDHGYRLVGGSSYITIENGIAEKMAATAVFAGGSGTDVTIDNMTFRDIYNNAVYLQDLTNGIVQNSTFTATYGATTQPLFLDTCTDWQVLNNSFTQQGTDSTKGNLHTASGSGGLVQGNTFAYGNWGTDINDDDVIVEQNKFQNHSGETWSSAIYISANVAIDNQLYLNNVDLGGSVNNVYIWDTDNDANHTNFKFYNNAFYGASSYGILITTLIDGQFKNNIVWGTPSNRIYSIDQIVGAGSWDSDYNVFAEDTGYFYYIDTAYDTLAAYATAKSQDANSISSDPLFVDAAGGNFTLQSKSPCINAGTDPFSDGDGDQVDFAGRFIWSDTLDKPVGYWGDGVDIGVYSARKLFRGNQKTGMRTR